MSGTTISTPSNSASGNMSPASMTMMSSPKRTAMQFIPNSPSPPRGMTCSFPVGIESNHDASTGAQSFEWRVLALRGARCESKKSPTGMGLGISVGWLRVETTERKTAPQWLSRPACGKVEAMPEENKSWLRRRVEDGLVKGLTRAYSTVQVNPDKFLLQLRTAYRLPISGYHGVYSLDVGELDVVADEIIRSGMKVAAVEGAGFGLGGLITIVPDLGILSAITMRTIQKLSLVYGFQFNTDGEIAELWIAAASAAGVDISRELLEKEVVNKFVPRVIQSIAARASAEVVEKWAGRMIPLLSSAIGAGLNYWFVRAWGERAKAHFRQRHLEFRQQGQQALAHPATSILPAQTH